MTTLEPPSNSNAPAPGGYLSTGEQRARRGEPPDGDDELTIGSVLFSLGLLRTGAAGITLWLARTPGRCPSAEPGGCGPLETYGWVGFGEGGLMVGTGLTYMIIGGVRRSRHRRWERGESVALRRAFAGVDIGAARLQAGPWLISAPVDRAFMLDSRGLGGGAQLRFEF